jgi:hypothetical protein
MLPSTYLPTQLGRHHVEEAPLQIRVWALGVVAQSTQSSRARIATAPARQLARIIPCWSIASAPLHPHYVRPCFESGGIADIAGGPRRAKSSHDARGQKALRGLLLCGRSLHLPKGKFDFAAHTICREHQINRASKFVRNKITYQIKAIAGLDVRCHLGAAKFAPD